MKNKIQILILAIMLLFTSNSLQSADSLWTKIDILPTTSILNEINFINKDVGFIVGSDGIIYKTIDGGLTWELKDSGTKEYLYGISFPDSTNGSNNKIGYTVGYKGTISITTDQGETWTLQKINTKSNLNSVKAFSHNYVWVAGDNGLILRTSSQGMIWDSMPTNTKENLYDLHTNSNHCWAVGGDLRSTIIFSTNSGAKWRIQNTNSSTVTLNSIHFVNRAIGWAVGSYGTIFNTIDSGNTWLNQMSEVINLLVEVKFVDTLTGWAIGKNGVILNTENGGIKWTKQNSGTIKTLTSMYFFDKYNGFAVGLNGTLLKYKATPSSIEAEQTTNTNLTQSTQIELFDILGRSIAIFQSYEELKANIDSYTPPHLVKWRDSSGIYHFEKMK